MAKKQIVAVKSSVVSASAGMFKDRLRKTSDKGRSTAPADNLVPLIKVLQRGSPEVNKKNASYIDGAEAGDFLLKNAPEPLVKGADGFVFQACHHNHVWVEWVPREKGGGFAGVIEGEKDSRGNLLPPRGAKVSEVNKFTYIMPNGNELKDTRYVNGYVYDGLTVAKNQPEINPYDDNTWCCSYNYKSLLPFSLPFTSTGHTVFRNWMGVINSRRLPTTPEEQELIDKGELRNDPPNLFTKLWLFTTHETTNAKGTWSQMDITVAPGFEDHYVTLEDFNRGDQLFDAFESGQKQVAAPDPEDEAADDGEM